MSLSSYPIPTFPGLNLVDDPEEIGATGAVDLLNVDLDKRGRVRSRDGYNNLLSAASITRLSAIAPFYKTDGTKQIIVGTATTSAGTGFYRAYSTAGVNIASQFAIDQVQADFTRFGGPGAEVVYATSYQNLVNPPATAANSTYSWDGAAWAFEGGLRPGAAGVFPLMLEVQSTDNRLVGVFSTSNYSRVAFSGAGTPTTWGVNDFVDLTPGDGERITALCAWRELVFVFKESKYFVFTGNSTTGTGTPLFNYRPVSTGVGTIARQCAVATPNGVYFLSRRGIYKTTGGDPQLVSRAIDPVFRSGASALYQGGVLNHTAIDVCKLTWHDERLYFAYPSGSSTANDRILVFDPETGQWFLWNIAANGMMSFRIADTQELLFTYAAGTFDVGRVSTSFTDDDGVAIASRYQSGYYQPSSGNEVSTRWTELWGTGTPTFDIYTDDATSDPLTRGGAVTLGTSPAVAKGYHLKAYTGQLFSHKLSSTSGAWSVNRIEHQITNVFQPH